MDILGTLQRAVDDLKRAGLTGSHFDPELVDPPSAAWIDKRTVRDLTLDGGGTLTAWIYLLALPGEDDDAAAIIGKLDDTLAGVLEYFTLTDGDDEPIDLSASVLLPGRAVPLPAYRLAVDLELETP